MLIVESRSPDVCRNLAIEEHLMEEENRCGPILFLWRSDRAVVIGKNQNPWRECRLDRMAADGVPLARRVSGGGAVYHDAGNLNYCVIADRSAYRPESAFRMVLEALDTLNIEGERTGKSNLSVGGAKFSGNAFCYRRRRVMHHGTLLLHADLERLGRYLGPVIHGIETKAVVSEPAPVTNLNLGMEETIQAIAASFASLYGGGSPTCLTDDALPEADLMPLIGRHRSAEWLYGSTPRFSVEINAARLEIEHGIVTAVEGPDPGWTGQPFSDIALSVSCRIDGGLIGI